MSDTTPQNPSGGSEHGSDPQRAQPPQPQAPQPPVQQPQAPRYAPPPAVPQQVAPPQAPPGPQPPPQGPPYQAPQYMQQPQQPQAPLNALALVAFIGSFFVSLVGIICGHIALGQIKKTGERGHGFALAGTIIGYVSLGLTVLGVILMFVFWGLFAGMFAMNASNSSTDPLQDPDPFTSSSAYGPEGMDTGAVVFDDWLEPIWTPGLEEGQERAELTPNGAAPLSVTVYVDYMCPHCGAFEQDYGMVLEDRAWESEIEVGIYPVAILDSASLGSEYSTRAANLVGCVVQQQPWVAWPLHHELLAADVQPAQSTEGFTDDELLDVVENVGGVADTELRSCVEGRQFAPFFADNTEFATTVGLIGLESGAEQQLQGTPTVVVEGEVWDPVENPDFEAYLAGRLEGAQ